MISNIFLYTSWLFLANVLSIFYVTKYLQTVVNYTTSPSSIIDNYAKTEGIIDKYSKSEISEVANINLFSAV